jgi:hypothetical protein
MACKSNLGERSVPERLVNEGKGYAGGSVTLQHRLTCRTVEPHGVRSDKSQLVWVVGRTMEVTRKLHVSGSACCRTTLF